MNCVVASCACSSTALVAGAVVVYRGSVAKAVRKRDADTEVALLWVSRACLVERIRVIPIAVILDEGSEARRGSKTRARVLGDAKVFNEIRAARLDEPVGRTRRRNSLQVD